jgi:hypothetical protein
MPIKRVNMQNIPNTKYNRIVLERPRDLLLDWVNLDDEALIKRNPGLLKVMPDNNHERGRWLEEVRRSLRRAWDAKLDPRGREWYLFSARWQYEQARLVGVWGEFGRDLYPAAPRDPFHQAIFDLQESGAIHKLSMCANADCRAPYFIRRRQKKQPYCTTVCHREVLREIKRRWHRENRGKAAKKSETAVPLKDESGKGRD